MHASSLNLQRNELVPAHDCYPDQFTPVTDALEILIPRQEILAAMLCRGEEEVLDEVCLAVAISADAWAAACEDF